LIYIKGQRELETFYKISIISAGNKSHTRLYREGRREGRKEGTKEGMGRNDIRKK